MNPSLPNPINASTTFEDDETFLTARNATRALAVINAQIPAMAAANGLGVRKGVGNELLVAAGAGLSVSIATGAAVVGGVGDGMGCEIQLADPFVKSGLTANRGSGSPLYLFARFDTGDMTLTDSGDSNSITRPDSFESRQGVFDVADTPTVAGQVLLAKITTSSSAVLTVEDMRQFIEAGSGSGVPDGGTTGQILAKQSDDDGDAVWVDSSQEIPQQILLSSTGAAQFQGSEGVASITPGDANGVIKTQLATALGIDESLITSIAGDNEEGTEQPTYTVAGAPDTSWNGVYPYDVSDSEGHPYFKLSSTRRIQYNIGLGRHEMVTAYGGSATYAQSPGASTPDGGAWPSGITVTQTGTTGAPGTFALTVTIAGGVNYVLTPLTSGATPTYPQPGNIEGAPASVESLDELRQRVQTIEASPEMQGDLRDIAGLVGDTPLTSNADRNFAVNTSGGSFSQPIPTVSGRSGQTLRFTKTSNDANTCTLDFDDGAPNIVLANKGDTITIQAYTSEWFTVYRWPVDVSE